MLPLEFPSVCELNGLSAESAESLNAVLVPITVSENEQLEG